MLKKVALSLFSILLAMCLLTPITALAESPINDAGDIVTPYWTYIANVTNSFDIDNSGRAGMSSSIRAYSGSVTSVSMINYLQRYENGTWNNVNGWSYSNIGTSGVWSNAYYVYSGYTYRLLTYFYAYNGSTLLESTSGTSGTKSY